MRLHRAIAVVAACSAALAALTAWSRREVRRGEEAFAPGGRMLDLPSGARLHVLEEGSGPPVVFIHGADGVALSFTETVTAEVARRHRVVAFDRPGHGFSAPPPGRVPDVALNVEAAREALAALGVERPIVVGHSYGGLTALTWALDHPDEIRALVLLAPVAAFPWRYPMWVLRLAEVPVLGRVLTDALVVPIGRLVVGPIERNAFAPGGVPPLYAGYSRALYLRPSQFRALAAEYARMRADVARAAPRFGSLRLPVEIVVGEGDLVTRPGDHARALAAALPDARLTVVAGAGHEFMWEHPDEIAAAVRRAEERAG